MKVNIGYLSRTNITERDEVVLRMYLDGDSLDKITDYLRPDRETKYEGKSLTRDVLRKLLIALSMPWDKRDCIKNKEAILKNLELAKSFNKSMNDFLEAEEKRLIASGFNDLSD